MAFNVAYYDLLNKNIRHIYSSLPSNIRFRCDPTPGVTLNPHDGCLTACKKVIVPQHRGMPERLYKRLWAYSPEYQSPMPRAPAFRCVTPDEARVITDRVSQMTRTHSRRRQSHYGEAMHNEVPAAATPTPNTTTTTSSSSNNGSVVFSSRSRHGNRCLSTAEMDSLTQRVMRPTTAFSIKCDLREGQDCDPVEVVHQRSAMSRGGGSRARTVCY